MLGLTLKDGKSFTLFHGGEMAKFIVKKRRGEMRLLIAAPQGFRVVRDDAKTKQIPVGPEPDRAA
jgi:hypothetical protein